jgi:large subunit ribosomal protein L17
MRHKRLTNYFGRDGGHRKAMIRNLVSSLVEHGRIQTTVAKAKELRRHVERAITLGKDGTLHAQRLLLSRYPNQDTVTAIMTDISPRMKNRMGGYTRILKTGRRPGDNSEMAFIEFVDYELPAAQAEGEAKVAKKAAPKKAAKKVTGTAAKKATAKTKKVTAAKSKKTGSTKK